MEPQEQISPPTTTNYTNTTTQTTTNTYSQQQYTFYPYYTYQYPHNPTSSSSSSSSLYPPHVPLPPPTGIWQPDILAQTHLLSQYTSQMYSYHPQNLASLDTTQSTKKRKLETKKISEEELIASFDGDTISEEIFEKMIPFMEFQLPDSAFQRQDDGLRGVIPQRGSLLDSDCDVVIHCCNCFHKMKAGIATKIQKHYPLAYETDKHTPKNDKRKLGHYSAVLVDGIITFINLYAQFDYGPSERKINYAAMRLGLQRFVEQLKKIENAYPKIGTYYMGCFHSGGKKEVVTNILNDVFVDYPVYLYIDKQ